MLRINPFWPGDAPPFRKGFFMKHLFAAFLSACLFAAPAMAQSLAVRAADGSTYSLISSPAHAAAITYCEFQVLALQGVARGETYDAVIDEKYKVYEAAIQSMGEDAFTRLSQDLDAMIRQSPELFTEISQQGLIDSQALCERKALAIAAAYDRTALNH